MKARFISVFCLAACLFAACSSTDGYVDTVNDAQADVIDASKAIASDPNASKAEVLDALETAEGEAEDAVSELDEVDVPADAAAGHDELVAGFEELSALLSSVREEVADNGGSALAKLRSEGTEIDRRIGRAIDQINSDLGLE